MIAFPTPSGASSGERARAPAASPCSWTRVRDSISRRCINGAISIRRFHLRDLPRILRIERQAFGGDAWPGELFKYYARQCPALFLVAVRGARIAGYSIACPTRAGAELASIAVGVRDRGKGAATTLIRGTVRKLKRSGVPALWLTVRVENRDAMRLYRNLGFVYTRRLRGYYEDGSDGRRMRLEL